MAVSDVTRFTFFDRCRLYTAGKRTVAKRRQSDTLDNRCAPTASRAWPPAGRGKENMAHDDNNQEKDAPLSESNVSLRLADIQRRCAQMLDDPESELELALEEPTDEPAEPHDYFQRG